MKLTYHDKRDDKLTAYTVDLSRIGQGVRAVAGEVLSLFRESFQRKSYVEKPEEEEPKAPDA